MERKSLSPLLLAAEDCGFALYGSHSDTSLAPHVTWASHQISQCWIAPPTALSFRQICPWAQGVAVVVKCSEAGRRGWAGRMACVTGGVVQWGEAQVLRHGLVLTSSPVFV